MIGHNLKFDRKCEQALNKYEQAFSTKATMVQKYKDMPPNPNFPIGDEDMEMILHSLLVIEGCEIMCADSSKPIVAGSNMFITVTSKDVDFNKNAWSVLIENGDIRMELNSMFFAKLHGHVQDELGINWMVTAE